MLTVPVMQFMPMQAPRFAGLASAPIMSVEGVKKGPLTMEELEAENEKLRQGNKLPRRAAVPFLVGAAVTGNNLERLNLPGSEFYYEQSRKLQIDARAEESMQKYFPGALGSLTVDRLTHDAMSERGYTRENCLFATSTCPDEVNSKPGELIDLLKNRWGENFGLGGLGGVPFVGRAGFAAYSHHVADNGKMFILFAPHVGVEFDGKVGALKRVNQKEVSSACGAAVGAFKALMKEKKEGEGTAYGVQDGVSDYFDAQIMFIKAKLKDRLSKVQDAPDATAFVTYQMYCLVREFFIDEMLTAPGFWDFASEVTVLGGIMINRGVGGDRFMPLMMQSRRKAEGTTIDMYEDTFGPPPNLEAGLGGTISNEEIFAYTLDTFKLTSERKKLNGDNFDIGKKPTVKDTPRDAPRNTVKAESA